MKNQWRPALLIVLTLVFAAVPAAVFAQTALMGRYDCRGENPGGSGQYTGQVTIDGNIDGTYKFKWELSGQSYWGIGIRSGNAVSVAYSAGEKNFGIVVFNIEDGGKTLSGIWLCYPGGTGLGKETLTRK
jgi:hypothetical protein